MFFDLNTTGFSLALTILVALGAGLSIALLYTKTNSSSEYTQSFSFTLAVTTVIMSAVSMTIGTNIAVSIGLFGILSILRFRASVKNIKDMAYLLLSVATGLTTGSQNYLLTIFLGISFIAIVLLFKAIASNQIKSNEFIFVISGRAEINFHPVTQAFNVLSIPFEIKSSTSNLESQKQELTISVTNANNEQLSKVTESIKTIVGVESVSLITPYSTLSEQ